MIKNVTTKIDTLKLIEIQNEYNKFNDEIYLPSSTEVVYYVKDAKLAIKVLQAFNISFALHSILSFDK